MTIKPSVKIITLKILLFAAVATGLFWLADFYARANDIDKIAVAPVEAPAASSSQAAAPVLTAPAASSSLAAKARPGSAVHLPILMYHYISVAPATTTMPGLYLAPSVFEEQLKEISGAGYKPLFMSEAVSDIRQGVAVSGKPIALTFDDGYEDFYSNAFPLLKKYNVKGTLYVITNTIGKPGYVTSDQIIEMAASGFVEIGSHTANHPDLRQKREADAIFEIKASREKLEKLTNATIATFAYPYGYYDRRILDLMKDSGYLGAVSVIPGSYHSQDNLWLITRLRPGSRNGEEFLHWLERN